MRQDVAFQEGECVFEGSPNVPARRRGIACNQYGNLGQRTYINTLRWAAGSNSGTSWMWVKPQLDIWLSAANKHLTRCAWEISLCLFVLSFWDKRLNLYCSNGTCDENKWRIPMLKSSEMYHYSYIQNPWLPLCCEYKIVLYIPMCMRCSSGRKVPCYWR